MQGIYHQSLTGNQGQLGPFDPSIIVFICYLKQVSLNGNNKDLILFKSSLGIQICQYLLLSGAEWRISPAANTTFTQSGNESIHWEFEES